MSSPSCSHCSSLSLLSINITKREECNKASLQTSCRKFTWLMIYKESSPESETKWAELIRVRTKRWWWLIIVGFQFTHNTLYTAECARELPSCSSVQPKKTSLLGESKREGKPTITYDMCSCIRFNCFWSSQLFKAICSLALSYLLRASISSPPRLAACSHTSLWASSTRKLNSIKASESAKRRTKWNDVKEWVRERGII